MSQTSPRESYKIGRNFEKEAVWKETESSRAYHTWQRRLRGDLIETYKIINKKENINPTQFFQFAETGHDLRGHSLKLSQARNTSHIRQMFFSQRVFVSVKCSSAKESWRTGINFLSMSLKHRPSTLSTTDLTSFGNKISAFKATASLLINIQVQVQVRYISFENKKQRYI